ncbi:hypothetical protein HOD29_00595 [archaeon]|jgi:hypothetical protein|nr:hypothetical protein [archaeon]
MEGVDFDVGDSKKKFSIWAIFFILVVIVLAFVISIAVFHDSKVRIINVGDDVLMLGTSFEISENSLIYFNFNNEEYQISIVEINEASLSYEIEKGLEEILNFGRPESLDLDGDRESDLEFRINDIEGKDAMVFLEFLSKEESTCVENWVCTDWGVCINYLKKRVCVDNNLCETELDKPSLVEVCASSGIVEYKSEDPLYFPVGENVSYFDCGLEEGVYVNDCFVEASINCTATEFSNKVSLDLFGIILETNSLLRIKENEGKCVFYEEAVSLSIAYGEEMIGELLAQGYTQEEIDSEEVLANEGVQDYLGAWTECSFNKEDLTGVLEKWKEGDLSSSAECSFDLSGEFVCEYLGDFSKAECRSGIN